MTSRFTTFPSALNRSLRGKQKSFAPSSNVMACPCFRAPRNLRIRIRLKCKGTPRENHGAWRSRSDRLRHSPARNPQIPFDDKRIVDTDSLSSIVGLPREIIVVGAGVVGLEYASFLAALGTEVTLIDQRPVILDFVDREIMEALAYHLRQMERPFVLAKK